MTWQDGQLKAKLGGARPWLEKTPGSRRSWGGQIRQLSIATALYIVGRPQRKGPPETLPSQNQSKRGQGNKRYPVKTKAEATRGYGYVRAT